MRILRDKPTLLIDLLRGLGHLDLPPETEARVADSDLSEVPTRERRADLVLSLAGAGASVALVVEVQLRSNPEKPKAWLSYLLGVHERLGVPALLVVIAPAPRVATWAAGPFDFGGPGLSLRPIVLSSNQIPVITQVEAADAAPELAVLSAIAHAREPAVEARTFDALCAALQTTSRLDSTRAADYAELVWQVLPRALRAAWEERMRASSRRETPPFVQEWMEKGRKEGRKKGLEQGRVQALLAILHRRRVTVSPAQRHRIQACQSLRTLDRWIRRALEVDRASQLFAAPPRRTRSTTPAALRPTASCGRRSGSRP